MTDLAETIEDAAVVAPAPGGEAAAGDGGDPDRLEPVLDVPVQLSVEIGRATMTIREMLEIGPGSLIGLNKLAGEPVDLLVNGKRVAIGEVVAIDEQFGFRVTDVVAPERRLSS